VERPISLISESSRLAARKRYLARLRAGTPVLVSSRAPCLAGAELARLLSRFGINAEEKGCKCKSRAALMDANGCDWCEANVDTLVGWLRDEASRRGLPFLDLPARLLVKRAISNARRKEAAANAQRPPHHDRRQEMAPPVHKIDG